MLLSAHVKRVSVSCMRFLFCYLCYNQPVPQEVKWSPIRKIIDRFCTSSLKCKLELYLCLRYKTNIAYLYIFVCIDNFSFLPNITLHRKVLCLYERIVYLYLKIFLYEANRFSRALNLNWLQILIENGKSSITRIQGVTVPKTQSVRKYCQSTAL